MANPSKEDLERLYYQEGLQQHEIGELYDLSQPAINYWMDKYDISPGRGRALDLSRKELADLYYGQDRSQTDIADEFGVEQSVISRMMKEYGISPPEKWGYRHLEVDYVTFWTGGKGYERWYLRDGGHVLVHRLAAVAWYGFDTVSGNDVHHIDGVPWHTTEYNTEIKSRSDHALHHIQERERDELGRMV